MSWGYDLLHDARINPFYRWATRYTLRHSSAMVGDCKTIRQLAVSYGMPDERIVTFPWGVDIQHFDVRTFQRLNVQTFNLLSRDLTHLLSMIARLVIAARQRPAISPCSEADRRRPISAGFSRGGVLTGYFAGQVPYVDRLLQGRISISVLLTATAHHFPAQVLPPCQPSSGYSR
jgi:hypothetical protein